MSERISTQSIIIGTSNGWFVRRALPGDDITSKYYRTRTKKNNEKVDEVLFNELGGYIQDLFLSTKDFNGNVVHFMNLLVRSNTDREVRNIRVDMFNSVAMDIMDRIENVSIPEIVSIRVGFDKQKNRGFAWIEQNGMTIPKAYTRDNPGDKPGWKSYEIEGKTVWDRSDQRKFWEMKLISLRSSIQMQSVQV